MAVAKKQKYKRPHDARRASDSTPTPACKKSTSSSATSATSTSNRHRGRDPVTWLPYNAQRTVDGDWTPAAMHDAAISRALLKDNIFSIGTGRWLGELALRAAGAGGENGWDAGLCCKGFSGSVDQADCELVKQDDR